MTLEKLEKLEKSATPGPWHSNSYSELFTYAYSSEHDPDPVVVCNVPCISGDTATTAGYADMAFIAAFRNNAKALIAIARAAKEYVKDTSMNMGCGKLEGAVDALEKGE